jgi:hypothetical protein
VTDFPRQLPLRFFEVPYEASQIPAGDNGLGRGANCQRYAYAVLRYFGYELPPYRSSDLWADRVYTHVVEGALEPLDLVLFAADDDPYRAHVGLWTGDDGVLRLCRSVGVPSIWGLEQFAAQPEYRVLIGAKRLKAIGQK